MRDDRRALSLKPVRNGQGALSLKQIRNDQRAPVAVALAQ